MKPLYENVRLIITAFDCEDVITTSGISDPTSPENNVYELENSYRSFNSFNGPGSWF